MLFFCSVQTGSRTHTASSPVGDWVTVVVVPMLGLRGCDSVTLGEWLLTFREIMLPSSSGSRRPARLLDTEEEEEEEKEGEEEK